MMSYNNSKISQGLSFQYEEKQKEKKTNYAAVNNKTVNADYNGSDSFLKMQKGLKKSEKRADTKEISFFEEHTLNKAYIDKIFNSPNVHETVLLINGLQKKAQALNGYLLSGLKAQREDAIKELKDIEYVFNKYSDKIDLLVENKVLQRSSSDCLFRIE